MNPIALLELLSLLRHEPDQGFCDTPAALTYQGVTTRVRFDKNTGHIELSPADADPDPLFRELQALATWQHAQERATLLNRLRKRPF